MKILPISKVKTNLRILSVVEQADEAVTITRNGRPVAVIMSKDMYDGWQETLLILSDSEFVAEVRNGIRSEERRVGKEGRSRWSPYH